MAEAAFAYAKVLSNHHECLPLHWKQCFRTLVDVEGEFFQGDSMLPVRFAAAEAQLLPVVQHRRTTYRVTTSPQGLTHLEMTLPVPGKDAPRFVFSPPSIPQITTN